MPILKIDLATRVLDDQMQVNLIHPGARYVFYDNVIQNSLLPVDLPFFDVPDGQPVPDADQIAPMLERARIMRRWAKRPKSEARTPRPSRDLDFYRTGLNLVAGAQGARTRLRNAAQEILWDMPESSLVVIPQKGISGKAVLAELGSQNAARSRVQGHGHYAGLEFLARSVTVVNKVPMLALPADVLGAARSTSAVQNIGGHSEDRILRLAYGDYQRDSDFVAGVMANTDDFDALVLGQMIDLHVAIEHFVETGEVLEPGRVTWARRVAHAPYLHATINSPNGRASLESKGVATFGVKLLGIVAASGISLAVAGDLIAQGHVDVANSQEPGGSTAIIQASASALTNFFATSGYSSYNEYLVGLQNGLERNATKPQGTAKITP
ncbi:hypothetical protein [Pseudohalocynthiibacter sp. F2068]|uniref:hypothetical protein n=1 Tax=Pseudohalocynthiibacter sp. F2068 TaxID=2926418 RepID=UPI001FF4FD9C|nr:hypothetical protein [Pseudohalocynthiibacter sp. F2068]MCK0101978.1 hypothetical protein [Pseudohalocynthiibacter sp. F2068]